MKGVYQRKYRPIEDRFWPKVNKPDDNGCWLWCASLSHNGYGKIGGTGHRCSPKYAHRVSWELHFGPIPDAMLVLHKCDVPRCVNPSHLFLGTDADNMADKLAKGRGNNQQGQIHWRAKLTDADVVSIRRRRSSGEKCEALGREYGISNQAISAIARHQRWAHLKEDET
jgi:HNH endonuclease